MTYTLLSLLVRLVALTHDLGKMNRAFQGKLWGAIGSNAIKSAKDIEAGHASEKEYARHDFISYLILCSFSKNSEDADESIEALKTLAYVPGEQLTERVRTGWVLHKRLASAPMFNRAEELIKNDITFFQEIMEEDADSVDTSVEVLMLKLVAYLSLTHHKLPGEKLEPGRHAHGKNSYGYWDSRKADLFFDKSKSSFFFECITFDGANVFCENGVPSRLGQEFIQTLDSLKAYLSELPSDFDKSAFTRLAFHFARPSMVMSDYLGSGQKTNKNLGKLPRSNAAKPLLANTHRQSTAKSTKNPKVGLGDELVQHIDNVFRHASQLPDFSLGLIKGDLSSAPVLSDTAIKNIEAKRSPTGRFAWQHQAFAMLRQLRSKQPYTPVFSVVTAETGSGKTIASAQIALALGSTRYTYCLGLRSLTLQTGQSYKKDLGLSTEDLAVVIGDSVSQRAFNATAQGSDSLAHDTDIVKGGRALSEWLNGLSDPQSGIPLDAVFKDRTSSLIDTPVVVCTIDQLVGITRLATVSKAFLFLRVQSSDLILDEVDNYSPDELKHIQYLCYFMGLFRKNVTCLSASMGYVHTEALLKAYRQGIQDSTVLTGLEDTLCVSMISNLAEPECLVLASHDPIEKALTCAGEFNKKSIAAQNRTQPKVRHRVLNCTALDCDSIFEEMVQLHQINAVSVQVSEHDTRQVSAGYIRMNTVGAARYMAKQLFTRYSSKLPPNTEMAVVCYHAKYSALELTVRDRMLNTLTARKSLTAGNEFSDAAITELIKPLASRTPHKNLIYVVVTTSLIETGRDHDYDWAILEPNSHRSFIQSGGRVRRHREALLRARGAHRNLSVIRHPKRALRAGAPKPCNPAKVWQTPGPLTYLRGLPDDFLAHSDESHGQLLKVAARALKNMNAWTGNIASAGTAEGLLQDSYPNGVQSAIALTAPHELTNSAALLEQYVLQAQLLHPLGELSKQKNYPEVSGADVLGHNLILTDWAYRMSFRAGLDDDSNRVYLLSPDAAQTEKAIALTPVTKNGKRSIVEKEQLRVVNPNRVMLGLMLPEVKPVDEIMAEVLTQEVSFYLTNGFTSDELAHITSYNPEKVDDLATAFYNEHLGYNHRDVDSYIDPAGQSGSKR